MQCTGLSGRIHPALSWVCSTKDVEKIRVSLKMLAGDYLCSANLARDRGQDPSCLLCKEFEEDLCHLLTTCRATASTRTRLLPDLLNIVAVFFPSNALLNMHSLVLLTQFILDPTSLNLPNNMRIQPNAGSLYEVTSVCNNYCFAIHKERARQLSQQGHIKK